MTMRPVLLALALLVAAAGAQDSCPVENTVPGGDGTCVCPEGYRVDGGEACLPCAAGTYSDENGVTTQNGIRGRHGDCFQCPTDPIFNAGSPEAASQCSCLEGYYLAEGGDVFELGCTQCPPNTYQAGFSAEGVESCLECPLNRTSAAASSFCDCPAESARDAGTDLCVCDDPKRVHSGAAQGCVCGPLFPYTHDGGDECQICPKNWVLLDEDTDARLCECDYGMLEPEDGTYECACPDGETLSLDGGEGGCCPDGEHFLAGAGCVCSGDGEVRGSDGLCHVPVANGAVTPIFDCLDRSVEGAPVATFLYQNDGEPVAVPVGAANNVNGADDAVDGQPTEFQSGRVESMRVPLPDGGSGTVTWTLLGASVTAGPNSEACARPVVCHVVDFDGVAEGATLTTQYLAAGLTLGLVSPTGDDQRLAAYDSSVLGPGRADLGTPSSACSGPGTGGSDGAAASNCEPQGLVAAASFPAQEGVAAARPLLGAATMRMSWDAPVTLEAVTLLSAREGDRVVVTYEQEDDEEESGGGEASRKTTAEATFSAGELGANSVERVRVGLSGVVSAVVVFAGEHAGAIVSIDFCEEAPLTSCDDVLLRRPRDAPDGVYRILDAGAEGGSRLVYCHFDGGGNNDCGEDGRDFDEESITRGGTFRVHNHKSGNRRPPLYGLRLDGLGPGHSTWTFDFDHPSSDALLTWSPEEGRLHLHGHVYGGPDTGSAYAPGYPHRYLLDFVYEGVDVENPTSKPRLLVVPGGEGTEGTGGSITDLSVFPHVETPLVQHMYFRMKRGHRGESARYSAYGWLNHSGWPHNTTADFLFTVGGCNNADRRGWTLVMNQDTGAAGGGYFESLEAVRGADVNGDDPTAPLYSALPSVLPRLGGEHGWEYLMEWPGLEGRQVWQQRGNLTAGEQPGEWAPIELAHTGQFFAGLEPGSGGRAYADGSVDSTQWFYAVASFAPARDGCALPGPFGCVDAARLFARTASAAPVSTAEYCGEECDRDDTMQCVATVPWVGPVCVPKSAPATCADSDEGGGDEGEEAYCFGNHLLAYYPFDEGEGSVCHDRSEAGLALDLDLLEGASWDEDGGVRLGGGGGAATGAESRGPATELIARVRAADALTVELWLRAGHGSAPGAAAAAVFSLDQGDDCVHQDAVSVLQAEGGDLRYRVRSSQAVGACEGVVETAYGAGSVPDSDGDSGCVHVVATWNADDKRLYVNGVEVAPASGQSGDSLGSLSGLSAGQILRLGRNGGWSGRVVSLAVWDAAAGAADVAALHERGCGAGAACSLRRLEAEASEPRWVDPDGDADGGGEEPILAACSTTPAEGVDGWTRVLFQDYAAEGPFPPGFDLAARGYGSRSGGAGGGLYSALHTLESFRGADGFLFRLEYPGQPGLPDLVWVQEGNPAAGEAPAFRYSLGGCDGADGAAFGGLRLGENPSEYSFLDGVAAVGAEWAYAVGTTREMLDGMPVRPGGGELASSVALWVRSADFSDGGCSCTDGFECAADGLYASCVPDGAPATCAEAVASAGGEAGTYWLLPGGGDHVRTHCSAADADGRVWTRAFFHDPSCGGGFFEKPVASLASQSFDALRPCSCRFSVLDRLGDLAGAGGLDLLLRWTLADGGTAENVWRQTSLPASGAAPAAGYVPLAVRYIGGGFAGLALDGGDDTPLLSGGPGGHAYGVGSTEPADGTDLCPFWAEPGVCATSVELLVAPVGAGQPACADCGDGLERHADEFSACKCGPESVDAHCADLLERVGSPPAEDGPAWVDPRLGHGGDEDGAADAALPSLEVECRMTPDAKGHAGFTRVAYQDCASGGFFPDDFDLATQRYDPLHGLAFSMLNQLERLRGEGGFEFSLEWPGSGMDAQTWIQQTNPVTGEPGEPAGGYLSVSTPHQGNGWAGLTRSAHSDAMMDGSDGDGWFFAVGTTSKYGCGSPGPEGCVPVTALWARPADPCSCEGAGETCRYLDTGGHVCLPASLPVSCSEVAAARAIGSGERVELDGEGSPAFAHWVDGDGDMPGDPWQAVCVPRDAETAVSGHTTSVEGVPAGASVQQFCVTFAGDATDVVAHAALASGSEGVSLSGAVDGCSLEDSECGVAIGAAASVAAGETLCFDLAVQSDEPGSWDDAPFFVWLSLSGGEGDAGTTRAVVELPATLVAQPAGPADLLYLVTDELPSLRPNRWSLVTLNWAALECVTGLEAEITGIPVGWRVRYGGAGIDGDDDEDEGPDTRRRCRGRNNRNNRVGADEVMCPGDTFSTSFWVKPARDDCGAVTLEATATYTVQATGGDGLSVGSADGACDCVQIEGRGRALGRCRRRGGSYIQQFVYVVLSAQRDRFASMDITDMRTESESGACEVMGGSLFSRFINYSRYYSTMRVRCSDLPSGGGRHRMRLRSTCRCNGRERTFWWSFDVENDGDDDDDDDDDDDEEEEKRAATALSAVAASPLGLYTVSPTTLSAQAGRAQPFALTLEAGRPVDGVALSLATSAGTITYPDGASGPVLGGADASGGLAAGGSGVLAFDLELPAGAAGSAEIVLEVRLESAGLPVTETHRIAVVADADEISFGAAGGGMGALRDGSGALTRHAFEATEAAGVTALAVASASGPAGVVLNATIEEPDSEGGARQLVLAVDSSGAAPGSSGTLYADVVLSYKMHGVTRERKETVAVQRAGDADASGASSSTWTAAAAAGVAVGATALVAAVAAAVAYRSRQNQREQASKAGAAGAAGGGTAAAAAGDTSEDSTSSRDRQRSSSFTFTEVASQMAAGHRPSISEVQGVYEGAYADAGENAGEGAGIELVEVDGGDGDTEVANAELALQRSQDVLSRAKAAVSRSRRVAGSTEV